MQKGKMMEKDETKPKFGGKNITGKKKYNEKNTEEKNYFHWLLGSNI